MATKKATEKKDSTIRYRNFATVVYPESAPENWQEILSEYKIPAFISPLHDIDKNVTGEDKKAHYHVMLMFEGKKSHNQVKEVFDSIGGVGVEVVSSLRGYARYLCHLDNPEKAQYDKEKVKCFGGADYSSTIGLASDKYKALYEMEEFCDRYNVISFYTLCRYATIHRPDWSRVLKDNGAYYMEKFLKSRQWSIDNNAFSIVDPQTGEVIL